MKLLRTTVVLAAAISILIFAHRSPSQTSAPEPWRDKSPHREGFADANGVRLHYLDWGGRGEALVFLTGLGVSAHIFDDLAPKFTDRFRVFSYTRRGLGKSARPAGGYDTATLTEDLRGFLDAMKIERATLVGWSLAGTEMTRFAERHPERIDRLVYLDAAYDYATVGDLWSKDPIVVNPTEADMAAWEPSKKWFRTVYGFWSDAVEADGREVNLQPDGSVKLQAMPPEIMGQLFEGMIKARPDFAKIKSPVLAFYAVSREHPFASQASDAAVRAKGNAYWREEFSADQRRQIDHLKKALPGAKIVLLEETKHLCFVKKSDETKIVREMNAFFRK